MRRIRPILLGVIATVVVAVVAVVAWLCFSPEKDPDVTHTDAHVHFEDPGDSDAGLSASGIFSSLLSWNPSYEQSPSDAMRNTEGRLTGSLAEAAGDTQPTPKLWDAWKRSGDRVVATVNVTDKDIKGSSATVNVHWKQDVLHPGGEHTPYASGTATLALEKVEGVWKLADYQIGAVNEQ